MFQTKISETVLLSTHKICLGWEIRKLFNNFPLLPGGLAPSSVTQAWPIPYPLHWSFMNAVCMEWVTPGLLMNAVGTEWVTPGLPRNDECSGYWMGHAWATEEWWMQWVRNGSRLGYRGWSGPGIVWLRGPSIYRYARGNEWLHWRDVLLSLKKMMKKLKMYYLIFKLFQSPGI